MRNAALLAFVLASVLALVLALVLAACGDDGDHHTMIVIDGHGSDSGSHDAPAQDGPNLVKLDFYGTPDLIEYRDGTGPWVVPTQSNQEYLLHVTDDYQVVVACSFSGLAGNTDSEQLDATYGDGAEQFMSCQSGGTTDATFAVTGQMLLPGSVDMQDTATGATSPWSFSLNVSAGTHDLIAVGATKMLIRRNLSFTAATAVADLDVATAGTVFPTTTATVVGAGPGDTSELRSEWFTGNDVAMLSDTTDLTLIQPPNSLIAANDEPELELEVTNMAHTVTRSIFVVGPSPGTTFTLPPVLTGVTFGATAAATAMWGTLPAYTTVNVIAFGGSATAFLEQNVSATKAWLDKTGATSLAFESDAANYDPAWNVPLTGAFVELAVSDPIDTNGSTSRTAVIQGAGPTLLHSPLRDHRRARR
ncbi:MAG: hypothetical protein ABI591_19410 [Kofleriaceae bacterium]